MDDLHPLYWHWWILGLVLMSVEALLPGAFFLWFGIAGLAVGLIVLLAPALSIEAQGLIYAVLALGAAAAWRRLRRGPPRETTPPVMLNDRARLYVGRSFTLDQPIRNGIGELRVDDGQWRISGPELPAGAAVRVVAVDGTTLRVEALP